jgi:hypothetical protein
MKRFADVRLSLASVVSTGLLATGLGGCQAEMLDAQASDEAVAEAAAPLYIAPTGLGPGQGLDYFKCSDEYGTCVIGGGKYVAFGANGAFVFKAISGSFSCTRDTFNGADPAPGATKACYFANYTFQVNEHQTITPDWHNQEVAYGANGLFTFKRFSASFTCDNTTFGIDPIPGPLKACYFAQTSYNNGIVLEGGAIGQFNNQPVAFGANGKFAYALLNGNFSCSRDVFGDPAPGVQKACYLRFSEKYVGDEYQNYFVPLTVQVPNPIITVEYGSGTNGNFMRRDFVPQSGPCSNANFGGDPDAGPLKHCWGVQGATL